MDSSAWIEYLEATALGPQVTKIIEREDNIIMTPNIVAAEVISRVLRKGKNGALAASAIQALSVPAAEDQNDYFKAGEKHSKLKQAINGISLADAIILTLAERNSAKIVTKDYHLKGKNTIFIG